MSAAKPAPQEQLALTFLTGATVGVRGAMSIESDQIMSFGWYPICRRVEAVVWLRRQMYSEATARHIKAVRRALVSSGYVETGKIDESNRDLWWSWEKIADNEPAGATRRASPNGAVSADVPATGSVP
jgi:hypothetical protein